VPRGRRRRLRSKAQEKYRLGDVDKLRQQSLAVPAHLHSVQPVFTQFLNGKVHKTEEQHSAPIMSRDITTGRFQYVAGIMSVLAVAVFAIGITLLPRRNLERNATRLQTEPASRVMRDPPALSQAPVAPGPVTSAKNPDHPHTDFIRPEPISVRAPNAAISNAEAQMVMNSESSKSSAVTLIGAGKEDVKIPTPGCTAEVPTQAVPSAPEDTKTTPKAIQRWTAHEDTLLRRTIETYGPQNWKNIARHVPGRNHVQCFQRWNRSLQPGLIKGSWTPEEDALLRSLKNAQAADPSRSEVNWQAIAAEIPGRNVKKCRDRWNNVLDPNLKKTSWSTEEEQLLLQAQREYGNKWSVIAKLLQGRSQLQIRDKWRLLICKEGSIANGVGRKGATNPVKVNNPVKGSNSTKGDPVTGSDPHTSNKSKLTGNTANVRIQQKQAERRKLRKGGPNKDAHTPVGSIDNIDSNRPDTCGLFPQLQPAVSESKSQPISSGDVLCKRAKQPSPPVARDAKRQKSCAPSVSQGTKNSSHRGMNDSHGIDQGAQHNINQGIYHGVNQGIDQGMRFGFGTSQDISFSNNQGTHEDTMRNAASEGVLCVPSVANDLGVQVGNRIKLKIESQQQVPCYHSAVFQHQVQTAIRTYVDPLQQQSSFPTNLQSVQSQYMPFYPVVVNGVPVTRLIKSHEDGNCSAPPAKFSQLGAIGADTENGTGRGLSARDFRSNYEAKFERKINFRQISPDYRNTSSMSSPLAEMRYQEQHQRTQHPQHPQHMQEAHSNSLIAIPADDILSTSSTDLSNTESDSTGEDTGEDTETDTSESGSGPGLGLGDKSRWSQRSTDSLSSCSSATESDDQMTIMYESEEGNDSLPSPEHLYMGDYDAPVNHAVGIGMGTPQWSAAGGGELDEDWLRLLDETLMSGAESMNGLGSWEGMEAERAILADLC